MFDELLSPFLITTWGRRAGLAVMIVMAVLVFVTLITTLFTWRSDIKLAYSPSNQAENTTLAGNQLNLLIAQIPAWHLFGKYGDQSTNLPITSLQLRLVGVIKATPEIFSRVIISESNQPGKIYQVGDILPSSGVKIYAITADGVVLENSGRFEKLPLQRTPLQFQGPPKSLMGE
ncbi:MAG: type II secretion system protein N [Gammaproteobacteria bacterium]